MKRVILTGATGFVGANLTRRLLNEGHQVHLLVRPDYRAFRIEGIQSDVFLHLADLRDPESVEREVKKIRPEWVFHLAVHGAYSTQTDLLGMVQTNVTGIIHLVRACLKTGFEVLVNTGSSSEYGAKSFAPPETEYLEPASDYAITKACSTHYCRHTARSLRIRVPTLRLYSVYGPFEEPTRLVPTLIREGMRGLLPRLAHPDSAHDFVHVDDVCDAYLAAAQGREAEFGPIYNVGTGVMTTMREVVEVTRELMGIAVEPEWCSVPDRKWDTSVWVSDCRRIHEELGWNPRYSFEGGVAQTLKWYRQYPEFLSVDAPLPQR